MKPHPLSLLSRGILLPIGFLSMAAWATAATNFVRVSGLTFVPKDLTVCAGDTVVFTGGNNFHTVTGTGAEPFCGPGLFTSCRVTFPQPGTFPYVCTIHESQGMTGVIRVVTGSTSRLTVRISGTGTVTPNLDGQDLCVGTTNVITANPAAGFRFAGWTGGVTSDLPRLSFVMESNLVLEANFVDANPPVVKISTPAANARLTNSTVTLQGTASDNGTVAAVEYRVENAAGTNDYQPAIGTINWSALVTSLVPGTNRFRVRARDDGGNLSAEVTRSVILLGTLIVTTNGNGTVSGGFIGTTFRVVGKSLSILATSKPGFVFSNWTGSVTSAANPLLIVMPSNLVLQANFVPNPFGLVVGGYNGLFFVNDTNIGVRHESSGFFNFLLTDRGAYSGKLQLAGKTRPFIGRFDLEGQATNAVKRAGTNDLSMELRLNLNGNSDRVMGRVLDPTAGWEAELLGDRVPVYASTNPSPYRGKYTLVIEQEDEDEAESGIGDGFGTVNVDAKGKLSFKGTLGDGTPVTQSTVVSKGGYWPLYASLYGGKGSLLSWVTLITDPAPAASLYGDLSWIKPSLPGAKYYSGGFTNQLDLEGSIYVPPGTNKVLDIDNGTISFADGNLSEEFTNVVTLGPNNKVINLTTNQPLVLTITLPTGLFKGTVTLNDAGAKKLLRFNGALLQRQNLGAGLFLGTNQSGSVQFEPAP